VTCVTTHILTLVLSCSATRVVPRGTSRGVKKLAGAHPPNLGKLSDISEYLLGYVVGVVCGHVISCVGGMLRRVMGRSLEEKGRLFCHRICQEKLISNLSRAPFVLVRCVGSVLVVCLSEVCW
jgi:hypothetical protein